MRRKPGTLLDLEARILEVLAARGRSELHGFAIAKELADQRGSRRLTGHGTLYKALGRLEDAGAVTSAWEDSAAAERDGRPRRRQYRITGAGVSALRAHRTDAVGGPATASLGFEPR